MPFCDKTNIITVTLATKMAPLAMAKQILEEIYTIFKISDLDSDGQVFPFTAVVGVGN